MITITGQAITGPVSNASDRSSRGRRCAEPQLCLLGLKASTWVKSTSHITVKRVTIRKITKAVFDSFISLYRCLILLLGKSQKRHSMHIGFHENNFGHVRFILVQPDLIHHGSSNNSLPSRYRPKPHFQPVPGGCLRVTRKDKVSKTKNLKTKTRTL